MPNFDSSQFPSLPSGTSSVVTSIPQTRGRNSNLTIHAFGRRNAPLALTDENFPVLGVGCESSGPGTSVSLYIAIHQIYLRIILNFFFFLSLSKVKLNINQERGSTSKSGSGTTRNVSIHVNHKSSGEQKIKIRHVMK